LDIAAEDNAELLLLHTLPLSICRVRCFAVDADAFHVMSILSCVENEPMGDVNWG